ncbi:MAG: dockerin type I repeat-containing protein [Bacteroidaceae bacterium]|nr:dockerin type I repeat-containing protein [Bacteroidaceae bacterium]
MVAMLCGFAAMAQSPGTLSCGDVTATAGGETAYLEVKLTAEDVTALSGIQFSFTLPDGVSIAQYDGGDGDMVNDVTFPIAKQSHSVGVRAAEGGAYIVYLAGQSSVSFRTTTDVVARIGLKVAKTVTDGTYNINFVKAIVSDKSTPVQSYDVPDFSAKLTVTAAEPDDDTDISKLDNVIYLEKMEGFLGSSATLSFKMKNTANIRGFQFDLYLPEGVTPVVKNNRIQAKLSSGRLPEDDEHKLALQEQEDGSIRILCNSEYDETFTGNSGEIFTMTVNVAEDMAEGNYPIVMKQMRLSETDIDHYYDTNRVQSTITIMAFMLGDINGDGVVNVSDYIGVANHIMGNTPTSFNISAADVNRDGIVNVSDYIGIANIILTGNPYGNTNNAKPAYQKANVTDVSTMENVIYVPSQEVTAGMQSTLSFHMKNTAEIRGFQFDLYLPEGFTVVKNAKGRIQGALSSGRLPEDDEHTLTIQEQADGAIRFLCGSQYDETFTGNDGEIITLQINVPEDMKNGDYPVALKTMRLSETDISKYYDTDLVETTVTVVGGVGIADILEDSNTPAVIYNLSGQRLAKPQHGLNIVNGKKIIIK